MNDHGRENNDFSAPENKEDRTTVPLDRRSFIKAGLGSAAAVTGLGAALSPLIDLKDDISIDKIFQDHYERLSTEQMKAILERIKKKVKQDYGLHVHVKDL